MARRTRRSWRKLHIAVDADTGQIAAAVADHQRRRTMPRRLAPLLDQVDGPVASFTADGAYDQDGVYQPGRRALSPRRPSSSRHAPAPCRAAQPRRRLPCEIGTSRPFPSVAAWLGRRPLAITGVLLVEADISRFKRVIGNGLRSRTNHRRATEIATAVNALNRMLELGRPEYVRLP